MASEQSDKETDDFPVEMSNSIQNKLGTVTSLCLLDDIVLLDTFAKS